MVNLIIYSLLFLFIYTLAALYLDYLYQKKSSSNVEKSNDCYFGVFKKYPSTAKGWCKLIINVASKKLPYVPKEHLLTGVMCYGIDAFAKNIAESRHCFLIRLFMFYYDEEEFIKQNVLLNLHKTIKY